MARLSALALAILAGGLLWVAARRPVRQTAEGLLAIADAEPSATAVIPALGAFVNQDGHARLTFEPVPATRLVRLRATAPAAGDAIEAIATIASQYIEHQQAAVSATLAGEHDDVSLARRALETRIAGLQEEIASLRADAVIRLASSSAIARGALARARVAQLEVLYSEIAGASAPNANDLRVASSRRALDIAQEYEVSRGRERAAEAQESAAREDAARVAAQVAKTSDLFAELRSLREQSAELLQRERALDSALESIDSGARLAGPPAIVAPARPIQVAAWLTLSLAAVAFVLSCVPASPARRPGPYSRFRLPGRRRPTVRVARAA